MEIKLLVFIILVITSIFYLKLAKKYNIVDKPNQRSSHKEITIRGGGIIFSIALVLFFLFNNLQYPYFISGVLIISIVSFLDDIYTLSSRIRLPFQFIAVLFVLLQVNLLLNPIHFFLFAIVLGIGIINMFNFMDGINGITGIYSLSVLSGFFLININESIVNSDIIIYVVLSILIFGFFNFRKKALLFAGDIGSITLGMLIFFLLIYFMIELSSILLILLFVVYGVDALFTLLYRLFIIKENPVEAHRHHLYQKLVDIKKMSHLKVSIIYSILQVIVNFVIFKTYAQNMKIQIIVFLCIAIIFSSLYILIFRKLKFLTKGFNEK